MAPRAGSAPRVLQVVLSLHPGGTERLVVDIVRRLRDELPMAVCCLDDAGAWGEALRDEGVSVHALGRTTGFHPSLGHGVAQAAATHRANVIHCHHYSPFVYSTLARVWRPGLRIVFTEHGRLSDAPPSTKRRAANMILARTRCDVAAVSAHLKAHMVAEGFPADKVRVVYNGISVGPLPSADVRQRVRSGWGVDDEAVVVGTIGRLDPVKDLGTLVGAMAPAIAMRRAVLVVIGDGAERAALERAARERGAEGAVRFLGHREDARDLLAACDVYANSSIHEGISLTILEAMAAGLPVVATRVGGTPEILDESCGCLVPARNPDALAAAIAQLAGDEPTRRALGRAARARVEERFTIERMVAEYRDMYVRTPGLPE